MVAAVGSALGALRIGARGYVLKGAAQEEVLAAVRTVAAGGAVLGVGIADHVLASGRPRGRYAGYDLTEREADVLAGIAGGKSNAEIASDLGVSVKTVQNHVSHMLAKLQVRDRTQAALRVRGH
jgi:DNA-binding NarL/FixJ family response regulator